MTMITDTEAEAANEYIMDNAGAFAKAKAEYLYLEQFRKSKKALIFLQKTGTVAEREAHAYGDPDYISLLDGIKVAVETMETLRWKIEASSLKIEIWRTQQANNRKGY